MMNRGKAIEMLCFNKKINSREAEELGLITRTFKKESFSLEVDQLMRNYASMTQISEDDDFLNTK